MQNLCLVYDTQKNKLNILVVHITIMSTYAVYKHAFCDKITLFAVTRLDFFTK